MEGDINLTQSFIDAVTDTSVESPYNMIPFHNEVKKSVYIDSLTGCYNLKYFQNFKENNFDPERDNNNVGLIMIDNNGFKEVNDTFGHDAGDQVLKDTVQILKLTIRKGDIVIRVGGDEFLIVCRNHENDPNFKENLPLKITERLNNNLSIQNFQYKIDLAFGIAVYDKIDDNKDISKTYKRADSLMYEDKKSKKSRSNFSSQASNEGKE